MARLLFLVTFLVTMGVVAATEYIVTTLPDVIDIGDVFERVMGQPRTQLARRPRVNRSFDFNRTDANEPHRKQRNRMHLVEDLEVSDIQLLLHTPGVIRVEENVVVVEIPVFESRPVNHSVATQSDTSGVRTDQWNLDRIDQSYGMDGMYTPSIEGGSNVDIIVFDTGINPNHVAFTGRVTKGFGPDGYSYPFGDYDCHGHGTHVASTAAGVKYGVATGATIIPIRVLGCGTDNGGLYALQSGMLWALDYMENRRAETPNRKFVVNMSIEASIRHIPEELRRLIKELHFAGAVVVVAAANANSDACDYWPAVTSEAITVGASTRSDTKWAGSNYGKCVDIFAPGHDVLGAAHDSNTGGKVTSGTSMASPLVAGVAATVFQRHPSYDNTRVIKAIYDMATPIIPVAYIAAHLPIYTTNQCYFAPIYDYKMLQALSAASRPTTLDAPLVTAYGQTVKGEFTIWAPELTLAPKNDEICFTFKARVKTARNALNAASVRLVVAKYYMPLGTQYYTDSYLYCRITEQRFYVIDSFALDGSGDRGVKIWNTWSVLIGSAPRPARAVLSRTATTQFYVTLKKTGGDTIQLVFGTGDGLSEQTSVPLVSIVDGNFGDVQNTIRHLSFSSTEGYDIEYTDTMPCGGVPPPVSSPTPMPTHTPTKKPTKAPTKTPTKRPTRSPTKRPTKMPTKTPTRAPTKVPTKMPTKAPTRAPTKVPTKAPTNTPTAAVPSPPSVSLPTYQPTKAPTKAPTKMPTKVPTKVPTKAPTKRPTKRPTKMPTKVPTRHPTMLRQTESPKTVQPPSMATSTPTSFSEITACVPTPYKRKKRLPMP